MLEKQLSQSSLEKRIRKQAFYRADILALAGSPSGSIAAITETGDLLVAGSFKGDPDKIRECWKEHIKPVIMEAS